MKRHMLSLSAIPIVFCCLSFYCSGAVNPPAVLPQTRINYLLAYWADSGDAVKQVKESEQVWRKKIQSETLEFEYVLTKDNQLTISSYHQGRRLADFCAKVGDERDVEEVLSIIKGLKPRKG